MRDPKGNWLDLFNGFKLALDTRKMFLAFCGILVTLLFVVLPTCLAVHASHPDRVAPPTSLAPHQIYNSYVGSLKVLYHGCDADCPTHAPKAAVTADGATPKAKLPWYHVSETPSRWTALIYSIVAGALLLAIWSVFGGAIARIAAYEVAKGGERIELKSALKFSHDKFTAFFWAPLICILGFIIFYLCTVVGGLVGWALNYLSIGAPLIALLLPLALLAGFIMVLIVIGTVAGFLLFKPAVAAEGTDSFDAVSRGFSYIYARPWQFLWYQAVNGGYGLICTAFVVLFTFAMCSLALQAGIAGFGDDFAEVNYASWSHLLGDDHRDAHYPCNPRALVKELHPYGRVMTAASAIALPDQPKSMEAAIAKRAAGGERTMPFDVLRTDQKIAAVIVVAWLVIVLGMAAGYAVSFLISSQTLVYFILRKKVDSIEMNEVYEEETEEDDTFGSETAAPAPASTPAPETKA